MNLHFEELTGTDGARIGIASLDAENSLNALSLPMINALRDRMEAWAKDPQIVCVLLRGNGAKAFAPAAKCAAWWKPVASIRVKYRHWLRSFLRRSIAWTSNCTPTPSR